MKEEEILHLFVKKKWTLSVAESCTGGLVAARLVQIAGASDYFLGSITAYCNQAKENLLKVPHALIEKKGAVSEEVAIAMSEGVRETFSSEVALATTGIAGPTGATPSKPVGLVWFAISKKGLKTESWSSHFQGNRKEIIEKATNEALEHIFDFLNH